MDLYLGSSNTAGSWDEELKHKVSLESAAIILMKFLQTSISVYKADN
jgi:hypothetical protein